MKKKRACVRCVTDSVNQVATAVTYYGTGREQTTQKAVAHLRVVKKTGSQLIYRKYGPGKAEYTSGHCVLVQVNRYITLKQ